jgi:hypothetical protein
MPADVVDVAGLAKQGDGGLQLTERRADQLAGGEDVVCVPQRMNASGHRRDPVEPDDPPPGAWIQRLESIAVVGQQFSDVRQRRTRLTPGVDGRGLEVGQRDTEHVGERW